jgi:F-type H+-transporting ATPase subunit delta
VKQSTVARNYAEALIDVARREQAVERFGELLDAVAGAISADATVHAVMMSPRVTKAAKARVLEAALKGLAPAPFVKFLAAVVRRGRQGLLTHISVAYQEQVDLHFNRVHAAVVTAHDVGEALGRRITERLAAVVGKDVVPHFRTDPGILGGVVVRVGDRVLDGSVRRRLQRLRHAMMHGT